MVGATSKQQLEMIDGTPRKRLFLSIISDYDLQTGLCELVDNALDLWMSNQKRNGLKIEVSLDAQRQLIFVKDNAGGVKQAQLDLLIAPGASRNVGSEELIGIFGVGGKRAGVALGEHVEIKTRAKGQKSLQLDITNEWLSSEDWGLAAYEIPDIESGTTSIEISKLRQTFDDDDIDRIRIHLGETYKWYLQQGCKIELNDQPVAPVAFDAWAYPPKFVPRTSTFQVYPASDKELTVTITAGLITDRDPERENYGVYFYCNHRLIVKELRVREVGYNVKGEAGVPHPDASLCRVIIELQGPAAVMPWNSSKSGINFSHPAFAQLRSAIIEMTSFYSSLSRRLKHDWNGEVFAYPTGSKEAIEADEVLSKKKIVLPSLPRVRKFPYAHRLIDANFALLKKMPWTRGLIEAMAIVDTIENQKLDTKNRAALILLDSNFEIALKEFIVNRADLFPPNQYNDAKIATLFKARHNVINEVDGHAKFGTTLLGKVKYYYNLRNKLIHERASVGITDSQVEDYREVVEKVLKKLFMVKFPTK